MSATSVLENEDLENVPLVRMEDVQPDRYEDVRSEDLEDDNCEIINDVVIRDEVLETCVVDSVGSDCVVNDEDGNVVVTIHAEVYDGNSAEIIVPDLLEPPLDEPLETVEEVVETKPNIQQPNTPCSWPTLEILPGGVIKHADKYENEFAGLYPTIADKARETSEEMMYVCAKCSQSFKYLFCLVKHVKWHEEQQKKAKERDVSKTTTSEGKKYVCLHSNKRKIISKLKSRCKIPKKS